MKKNLLFLTVVLVWLNAMQAQSTQVIPNMAASSVGTGAFLGPLNSSARTYQLLIHENQLTALVGRRLNGISFRRNSSASGSWPATNITCANYNIYLSGSVEPAQRNNTFAGNVVGTQVQMRSGSLTIPAGSYPAGGTTTGFGPAITFDSAYYYAGGHLLIEIRQDGLVGGSTGTEALSTTASGYGSNYSACWQTGVTSASGTAGFLRWYN